MRRQTMSKRTDIITRPEGHIMGSDFTRQASISHRISISGRSDIARRIRLFNNVRDIPYCINLVDRDLDRSSSTKARMLQTLLDAFHVEARRICCMIPWKNIPLPRDLIALAPEPNTYHEYLEVRVQD